MGMIIRFGAPYRLYRLGLELARCNALNGEVPTTLRRVTLPAGSLASGWVDRHDSAGFCFKTGCSALG